jgi:Asp-tRNA(Asn)/Glu-tRNA(Gln) amidotransferase A subunit family amidase
MAAVLAMAAAALPALVRAQAAAPATPFLIEEATITSVHDAMQRGALTCRQLVEAYLRRIDEFDKNGPAVNAIVLVNPEVLHEADALDTQFKAHGFVGPLHCVPLIVKDNYETIGLQSAAGSLSLKGFVSDRDAFVVARLKAEGALVLAKSNMAEFAMSGDETLSSILPGYTRNPYDTSRVTSGSSGGTAVAVAANFGLVGLGTDTGTSIRGPASNQSLVGIRPTMGLISRSGIVPLNLRADTAGPIARTVTDAALIFQAMVGPDPDDAVTAQSASHLPQHYVEGLDRAALRGARIGVLRQAWKSDTADPEIMQVFDRAIREMKSAGAVIVDPASLDDFEHLQRPKDMKPCEGFKYEIDRYLASRGKLVPVHSLAEILKSGKILPGMEARLTKAEKDKVNGPDSQACRADAAYRKKLGEAVLVLMDKLNLDALIYPTWTNEPRLIGDLNTPEGNNNRFFAPTTGFPAVQVQMGYTRGGMLPAGVSFFGRPWSEARLLALAYSYEQATHYRRPPTSTPPLRWTQGLQSIFLHAITTSTSTSQSPSLRNE